MTAREGRLWGMTGQPEVRNGNCGSFVATLLWMTAVLNCRCVNGKPEVTV
jgi:hypothetical protein